MNCTAVAALLCVLPAIATLACAQGWIEPPEPPPGLIPDRDVRESPADRHAHRRLETTVPQLRFDDTPLEDVIQFIRDVTRLSIHVRWKRLKQAGIERRTRVTAAFGQTSLSAALAGILEGLSAKAKGKVRLDYAVKSGVVVIGTVDGLKRLVQFLNARRLAMRDSDPKNRTVRKRLYVTVPMLVFTNTKIEDVFQFLRDVTKAPIDVRWDALAEAGVRRMTPVTMRLYEVALATALEFVLDEVSPADDGRKRLDYVLRKGRLVISTAADFDDVVVVRRYSVHEIVTGASAAARKAAGEKLIQQILTEIDPPSWRPGSGTEGSIAVDGGVLIVRQSRRNQAHIQELLEAMQPQPSPTTQPAAASRPR